MNLNYSWKYLKELSTEEFFTLFQLRQQVFVVEQDCVYLDMDEIDRNAVHLLVQDNNDEKVVATLRIFAGKNNYWHIGRVAVAIEARKRGVAREMMERAVAWIKEQKGVKGVEISAQSYLFDFYRSLGFQKSSEEYVLDGLPHLDMILPL
ncbi:MAG: GNAT family N-acetyltransferase [Prolixibacteraceae bacterium]|jgi:ElaA protein|nr:GNAT family N-acetyltransferase [Prolixibacteraceae bacterium]